MKAFPEVRKNFYELFFKKWGKLSYMDFYCFRQRYEDEINFLQLFKEISSDYYKENEYLDNQKRAILENSPWFMKLRVNLKYPTNRSKRESFRLNEEWLLFLLEDKKTFLIYRKEKDERDYKYITEHSVNYGVLDYDVYKDFLVILSEDKFLRVIYLWTLGEVYERKNENIKGLYVSGDDLIIEYEGICQKAEILESGEIDFKDIVKGKEEGKFLGIGSKSFELIKTLEGHSYYVISVSFSPDGKYLASGGSGDKTIKIWEITTYKFNDLSPIKVNDLNPIKVLKYLIDEDDLYLYCEDNSIRKWSIREGVFRFKGIIGKEEPGNYKEIKGFEIWVLDNDFIILKDNKVCGSENFKNYINVLLGTDLDNYLNFEEFLKLNIREVIK